MTAFQTACLDGAWSFASARGSRLLLCAIVRVLPFISQTERGTR